MNVGNVYMYYAYRNLVSCLLRAQKIDIFVSIIKIVCMKHGYFYTWPSHFQPQMSRSWIKILGHFFHSTSIFYPFKFFLHKNRENICKCVHRILALVQWNQLVSFNILEKMFMNLLENFIHLKNSINSG